MDDKKKKIILLIVLGLGAIFSIINGIVSPPKNQYTDLVSTQVIEHEENTKILEGFLKKRHAKHSSYKDWGENPFLGAAPKAKTMKFILNGVLWDDDYPQAIINDDIVGLGGEIKGYKVKRIEKNKIILNDGTNDIEIGLSE